MTKSSKDRDRATLFTNGGSQAVRLPKAYRFEGSHVLVHREGRAVILEPSGEASWPEGHWDALAALGPVTDDFALPEDLPASAHRDRVLDELDPRGGC
jgi:antitoxin VapB